MLIKIAAVQFNSIVGDIKGNADKIISNYIDAKAMGADIVVCHELALCGYNIGDLLFDHDLAKEVDNQNSRIRDVVNDMIGGPALIYGTPHYGSMGAIFNAAYYMSGIKGDSIDYRYKYELPENDVFFEKRYFKSGGMNDIWPITWNGYNLGVLICEDGWHPTVSHELNVDGMADILISIDASPFEVDKLALRMSVMNERVQETGLPFLYVNQSGGHVDVVYDGSSFLLDGKVSVAPRFKECITIFEHDLITRKDRNSDNKRLNGEMHEDAFRHDNEAEEMYCAAVTGLRDFVRNQRLPEKMVLGYSGGVDSGIVAAIACDAFGPENVELVRLPSKYSSAHSLSDAAEGAKRLGAPLRTIHIEELVESLRVAYESTTFNTATKVKDKLEGIADENAQARARAMILMAISNNEGAFLLTTGNKSEGAQGYGTIYGDYCGFYNPIKDMYKVKVWDACRWRNELTNEDLERFDFKGKATIVVPVEIIEKAPSAELKPNQLDTDSLPQYETLDAILDCFVEKGMSLNEVLRMGGFNKDQVYATHKRLHNAEFKRQQSAPGPKMTKKAFGSGRLVPIVNRFQKD